MCRAYHDIQPQHFSLLTDCLVADAMTLSYHAFHFRALSGSSFKFWRYTPVIAKRFPSTEL